MIQQLYRAVFPYSAKGAGVPGIAPSAPRNWLRRFDDADRAELDALPRRFRNAIIADRKARVTAALERYVEAKTSRSKGQFNA